MIEITSNKILITNDIFSKAIEFEKMGFLVITPFTKISDLINLTKSNVLYKELVNMFSDMYDKILNCDQAIKLTKEINQSVGFEYLEFEDDKEKILKALVANSDSIIDSDKKLLNILSFINSKISKQTNICVIGTKFANIVKNEYNMINIIYVTKDIFECKIGYNQLEMLIINIDGEQVEITNGEKFHSWLELKVGSVLTRKDIDSYLNGEVNYMNLAIQKALR